MSRNKSHPSAAQRKRTAKTGASAGAPDAQPADAAGELSGADLDKVTGGAVLPCNIPARTFVTEQAVSISIRPMIGGRG